VIDTVAFVVPMPSYSCAQSKATSPTSAANGISTMVVPPPSPPEPDELDVEDDVLVAVVLVDVEDSSPVPASSPQARVPRESRTGRRRDCTAIPQQREWGGKLLETADVLGLRIVVDEDVAVLVLVDDAAEGVATVELPFGGHLHGSVELVEASV